MGTALKEEIFCGRKIYEIFLYDVDPYLWKFLFCNDSQTWLIAKIDFTKYFKMDQLPILILLFETLTTIYRFVFQKGVRHISISTSA